jgi:thiol peroxidase
MALERTGIVTFKGGPMTLVGNEVRAGEKAPDFKVVNTAMADVTLASSAGKTRVICSVPSLDTPVCSMEAKKFNEMAAALGDGVVVYTVCMDLPFAAKRFCAAESANTIVPLSDFKYRSFGENYGVVIKELGLLARAVFVVGPDDKVKYIEIVKEVAQEPDYDKALAAAK